MKATNTPWKITEELDGIKCPHCGGYNRLSVAADHRSVYCAECGDAVTEEYLRTQAFRLSDWFPTTNP